MPPSLGCVKYPGQGVGVGLALKCWAALPPQRVAAETIVVIHILNRKHQIGLSPLRGGNRGCSRNVSFAGQHCDCKLD
jgi:hypothetical protein